MLLLFPRCSWWSANEWILAPRIDVYGSASKGGKKSFSPRNIYCAIPLSLSLCIVICLIQILTRSKSIFLRGIFLTQFYTEYIPNLSRSSFHFRLISSINARVTRDNNNIQHVLRDANVTAPSLSLSLSSLTQSRMRSLYLSPLAFSIAPNSRSRKTHWSGV